MTAVTEDRGLGVAYERHVFYQRLDAWARRYAVTSMLEGPIDGIAGIANVHGAVLARRGVEVTCAVESEAQCAIAEAVYARSGGKERVTFRVVTDPRDVASLPEADMVLVYDALSRVGDARAYLAALGKLATRVLIVTAKNEHSVGERLLRAFRSSSSRTIDLASELAKIGPVREHVYFDAPWWPNVKTSAREAHVYGGDRWPYFGGPGWEDELLPAITKHPAFDGRAGLAKHLGHMQAFVVDKTKRRSLLVR